MLGKFRRFLILTLAALSLPLAALAADAPAQLQVSITVRDLTPKFLAFYDAAQGADPDKRFELWKSMYGFAAVPPGPQGDAMARELLDHAWTGYPAALPQIRKGVANFDPTPEETLRRVAALLQPDKPVNIQLIAYVGGLEKNAFTSPGSNGVPAVAVSVDSDPAETGEIMAHEMTHAVQISMGTMSGAWRRSIGVTVLSEGLAMRVTQKLYPSRPDTAFIERTPGWLAEATSKQRAILQDVRPVLTSDTSEDVFRYTIGKGGTGMEREAYYAGWVVVGYWLDQGMTPAQIARIPEAEAPARVAEAIDALLAQK